MKKRSNKNLHIEKAIARLRQIRLDLINRDEVYLTATEWLKIFNIASQKIIDELLEEEEYKRNSMIEQ